MRFASGSNKVFEALGKSGGFVGAGMGAGRGKGKRHRFNVSGVGLVAAPRPPASSHPEPAPLASKAPSVTNVTPDAEGDLLDGMGRESLTESSDQVSGNQNKVNPGVLDKAPKHDASRQIKADLDDSAMAELRKMNPKRAIGKGRN